MASHGLFRGWAARSFEAAIEQNVRNLMELLRDAPPEAAFLDLGCDDGSLTVQLAAVAGTTNVYGLELIEERAELAADRGIEVRHGDLNDRLPYEDETFDVVCSHQVIEHLADTDNFVSEVHRILKPGGFTVTSTENLASWHNIAALVLGWQPFSLSNVTARTGGLGNPLAIHRGEKNGRESWQHLRVFAYRGLGELFGLHGLVMEAVVGAGYYPLPHRLARVDARHAAFLTVKARRPAGSARAGRSEEPRSR